MNDKNLLHPWAPERWIVSEEQLHTPLPKITIGILSYNRREDLRRTLECVTIAIQYPDFEVVVVDNNSQDGSVEMVRRDFPSVRIIALPENIGTSGRNYFYQEATGEYVFSFDDDSFAATPATVFEAVTFLRSRPEIDALTFLYYQPLTAFEETGEGEMFRLSGSATSGYNGLYYAEGGMCIRTSAFLKTEGYERTFVCYGEGLDLAFQMYKLGMSMVYHTGFATLHMKSNTNRNRTTMIFLNTRNHFWTLCKHFPLYALPFVLFELIIRQAISSIIHPQYAKNYFRAIIEGFKGLRLQRTKSKKLSFAQVLGLKRWYLFLLRW